MCVRVVLEIDACGDSAANVFQRVMFNMNKQERVTGASFEDVSERARRKVGDSELREQVKDWMLENDVNIMVVANYAGKAVGTVKNWLYGTQVITDENQESLQRIMLENSEDIKKRYR